MGKMPAQTPSLLVKGGAAEFFSDGCINKLLEAGYKPEWFGSYKHVRNQIKAARKRNPEWWAWRDAQLRAQREGRSFRRREPTPRPTPADRYLGGCQSGHMSMDATHRDQSGRDNPCRYREFGYDTRMAPCMPQSAGPWSPPGSEHNVASRHEVACNRAMRRHNAGPPSVTPPDRYPADVREMHEDERTRRVVAARRGPHHEREPIDRASWDAARAKAGKPNKPTVPKADQIDGATAADCINAFRRRATAEMRKTVTAERSANASDRLRRGAEAAQQQPLPGETPQARQSRLAALRSSGRFGQDGPEAAAGQRAAQDEARRTAAAEEAANRRLGSARGQLTRAENGLDDAEALRGTGSTPAENRAINRNIRDHQANVDYREDVVDARENEAAAAAAENRAAQRRRAQIDNNLCQGREGNDFNNMNSAQQAQATSSQGMSRRSQDSQVQGTTPADGRVPQRDSRSIPSDQQRSINAISGRVPTTVPP